MPQLPALPIIRSAVSEGLSANRAYRALQQAAREQSAATGERWTGMRRTTFLETYAATVALRARVPAALQQQKNIPPSESEIVTRPTVRASGFGSWAITFSRQIGSSDIEQEFYFQRTEDALTPEEIERRAEEDFLASAQSQHGSKAGYVFLGTTYVGTERLQPDAG